MKIEKEIEVMEMTRGSGVGSQTRLSQRRQKRQRPNDKCPARLTALHTMWRWTLCFFSSIYFYSRCILLFCDWTHSIYIHSYGYYGMYSVMIAISYVWISRPTGSPAAHHRL